MSYTHVPAAKRRKLSPEAAEAAEPRDNAHSQSDQEAASSASDEDLNLENSSEDASENASEPENDASDSELDDASHQHQNDLRTLSFGALASAQDALPAAPKRRRRTSSSSADPNPNSSKEAKLQNLRDRLAELRERKTRKSSSKTRTPHTADNKDKDKDDNEGDLRHRSSKHAPTEQSSRKQVTRRRDVVETSHLFDAVSQRHRAQGDPRFNAAGGVVDREKVRRNYGFLSDYARGELQELKQTLEEGTKKRKRKGERLTEEQAASLRKEIGRRENRMKAEAVKEREREIASKHRREERERVREGKTPFYMKRGQVREQARSEAWEGMKKKDQEKAETKKRRRLEAKEMKRKPGERRVGSS